MNISNISHLLSGKCVIISIILFFVAVVFICAMTTDMRFSDEFFHYCFAKEWKENGQRPIYNKLADTAEELGYYRYYINAPLWHFVTKTTFIVKPSKAITQANMVFWYGLLIYGTYLLARTIYDQKIALYAAFVTATMPFIISFSILFFIDVPIAALVPFLILAVIKRRYVLAGIVMALVLLMKKNGYFLLPAVGVMLMFAKVDKTLSKTKIVSIRFLQLLLFAIVTIAIMLPNFMFRLKNFNGLLIPNDKAKIVQLLNRLKNTSYLTFNDAENTDISSLDTDDSATAKAVDGKTSIETTAGNTVHNNKATENNNSDTPLQKLAKDKCLKTKTVNYLTSPLFSLVTFLQYLGIILPVLLLIKFWLIIKNKDINKKQLYLLIPIIIYIPIYTVAFKGWWEIRYLSPVLPLIIIFASSAAKKFNKKISFVVFCAGIATMIASLVYVHSTRHLSTAEKEMFTVIKKLPDERILVPEELFISWYTAKPTIWCNTMEIIPEKTLSSFFWGDKDKLEILKFFKLHYILVPHYRNYDDSQFHHYGGYPLSFVNKMDSMDFLEKIYNNGYASLWRVKY